MFITTPFYCVLLAFVLNYLTKIPVGIAMHQMGGYDNHHPRDQQDRLTGWGKRALAAHKNCFENFPAFAAAVIIAHITQCSINTTSLLAVLFILARFCYVYFYIKNWAYARSTAWFVGFCSTFVLFLLPLI